MSKSMSDKKIKRDDLGNRMKAFYEEIPKTKLMRRTSVAAGGGNNR